MGFRPEHWEPVGLQTDPTPGDHTIVEALSAHLRRWSGKLERQAEAADDLVETGLESAAWSGLAADVFRDRMRALADAARVASARHSAGAAAATAWCAAMTTSQHAADTALRDAEDALADRERAEQMVASLGVEYAALMSVVRAAQKAYASGETSAEANLIDARSKEAETDHQLTSARFAVDDAEERRADARSRVQRAQQEYDAAEKTFASALDDALHGAVPATPVSQVKNFGSAMSKLAALPSSASSNASLMSTLAGLTPDELGALLGQDPALAQQFWEHPPSPDEVAKWWSSRTDEQKAAFETAAPEVLGNLAGLPYGVRNRCNTAVYEEARAHLADLTPEQRKVLDELGNVLADGSASLVCFNLGASVPMVAVGYGDLDDADTVTWAAPGMNSDAADATETWSRAAKNLYGQQRLVDDSRSHAVVGWLGYDTPDLVSVNNPALAQDGAWRFATELDGTHAVRAAKHTFVSVVAHSYGTTMAADALTHTKYPVGSFTMLGSAGIDTDTVHALTDLHVKEAHGAAAIYTTAARLDFLAPFGSAMGGRAEPNPEAARSPGALLAPTVGLFNPPKFMGGAQSFSSEGAILPNREVLEQTRGHSPIGDGHDPNILNGIAPDGHGYLDPRTESLRNTAYTAIGLPGRVVGGLRPTK